MVPASVPLQVALPDFARETPSEWFQRGTVRFHRCRVSGRRARLLPWGRIHGLFFPCLFFKLWTTPKPLWIVVGRVLHGKGSVTWKLHLKTVWTLTNLESKKLNSLAWKFFKSTFVCTWIKVALFVPRLKQPYFSLFEIQCTHIHPLFSTLHSRSNRGG